MILSKLEKIIEYKFEDKNFLKEALTHRSYINENPGWKIPHNERLEFLGDAVLELVVTEELYNRYPDYPEGKLTALRSSLVNYQLLAEIAGKIGLADFILVSRGEAKGMTVGSRSREVILANAMESLIGAIYLDSDYKGAKPFINKFVVKELSRVLKYGLYRDAKSLLQEKVQAEQKVTPTYKVLKETGPEHDKLFEVGVYLNGEFLASGQGRSKQEAELEAAKNALK